MPRHQRSLTGAKALCEILNCTLNHQDSGKSHDACDDKCSDSFESRFADWVVAVDSSGTGVAQEDDELRRQIDAGVGERREDGLRAGDDKRKELRREEQEIREGGETHGENDATIDDIKRRHVDSVGRSQGNFGWGTLGHGCGK